MNKIEADEFVKKLKSESTHYTIHVNSMLRLEELVGDLDSDMEITLPNVEGLDEAVLLINKLCSQKLYKIEEHCLNQFLSCQRNKIEVALKNGHEIKDILLETASYYKKDK
jgi:hypothetical protein